MTLELNHSDPEVILQPENFEGLKPLEAVVGKVGGATTNILASAGVSVMENPHYVVPQEREKYSIDGVLARIKAEAIQRSKSAYSYSGSLTRLESGMAQAELAA